MAPIRNSKGIKIYPSRVSQLKSGKYKPMKVPKCSRGLDEDLRPLLDVSLPRDLSGNGWIAPGRCRQDLIALKNSEIDFRLPKGE